MPGAVVETPVTIVKKLSGGRPERPHSLHARSTSDRQADDVELPVVVEAPSETAAEVKDQPLVIAAMSASCLSGPWVNASVNDCNIALAIDTFCVDNILAYDIAVGVGCHIVPHCATLRGVGGANVDLTGVTTVSVAIGNVSRDITFKVSENFTGFAFVGLPEMKRWGCHKLCQRNN